MTLVYSAVKRRRDNLHIFLSYYVASLDEVRVRAETSLHPTSVSEKFDADVDAQHVGLFT